MEIRDCRQYIEEGIYESQVCGDSAMLAQFTMQNVLLNLVEGMNLSETIPILKVGAPSLVILKSLEIHLLHVF